MTKTVKNINDRDLELIEMMIKSFDTEEKVVDVISKFAAKYRKTESSTKMRWNKIRPIYIEIAKERCLTHIVEDAERKSKQAYKTAETRRKNKLKSSTPATTKKTTIKKHELFDRFNKTDCMLDKLETMQKEAMQHIQISHKSNDARFNGISSMLKLIADNVDKTKQINHQGNGLVTVNKFGQVQAIGMNESKHLDKDKVLALIDEHEKLEDELKNEKLLRMTGDDLYNELKNEFNRLQDELTHAKKDSDDMKNLLTIKEQIIEDYKKTKSQLEHENDLLLELNIQLGNKNEMLANKNKLLNKRGLVDRLFNRDVEFDTVTN